MSFLPGRRLEGWCERLERRLCHAIACEHVGRLCDAAGCDNRICRLHEQYCPACDEHYCEDCYAAHLEACPGPEVDAYDLDTEQALAEVDAHDLGTEQALAEVDAYDLGREQALADVASRARRKP